VPEVRFEWDGDKEEANQRKHGVKFDEAASVFSDEHALFLADPDHSIEEDRFLLMGLSWSLRLLVVHHTFRAGGDIVRLISARTATRAERAQYARRWKP
jgi:uncharacterized DUF497 family protein